MILKTYHKKRNKDGNDDENNDDDDDCDSIFMRRKQTKGDDDDETESQYPIPKNSCNNISNCSRAMINADNFKTKGK